MQKPLCQVSAIVVSTILFALHGAAGADDSKLRQMAETILLYQRECGGWPSNYDRTAVLSDAERRDVLAKRKDIATIDNGATHTEIRLLADAHAQFGDAKYSAAAIRGIAYLLQAQYENGGWPQRFPLVKGYPRRITFNDGAMVGAMRVLREVASGSKRFGFVKKGRTKYLERASADAVKRGISCTLLCQVFVDGKRTVWCAQHDETTYAPRKGRSYELPSLSGSESVGIVQFLMEIEDPSPEVVLAIEEALSWFERSKLTGIKVVQVDDANAPGGKDRIVVKDKDAEPLWARFYDIPTNTPIFCSRDGIPRKSLAEISHERRNGYSWLGAYARDLLAKDAPAWRKRHQALRKRLENVRRRGASDE